MKFLWFDLVVRGGSKERFPHIIECLRHIEASTLTLAFRIHTYLESIS